MEWMILPLKRYADFSGRSRRLEYWMFSLFIGLVVLGGVILAFALGATTWEPGKGKDVAPPFATMAILGAVVIFYLLILIPAIAVQVRRFHDQDKSGWMILLNFIPYVGGIVVFVFMCLEGTPGANRFGPDPLGRSDASVFY
jgi:uncharacterized membrane protein YhaH (DUF805 family)